MIDYRKLLAKYMDHVGECEGITFVSDIDIGDSKVEFSDEEVEELREIDSETTKSKLGAGEMNELPRDADLVREFLERHDSFWHWDNHVHVAQLTSGKLSDFFVNCSPIFTDPDFQKETGFMLARALSTNALPPGTKNPWVVGSAMGAIGLAQSLAVALRARSAFTEPVDGDMVLKRFDLGKAPQVVVCEDVMSTGGTTVKTIRAILDKHPDTKINPVIPVVVDRRPDQTGTLYVRGVNFKVKGILSVTPRVWDSAEDLPPDMRDCVPVRPKGNWGKLKEKRNG